MKGIKAVEENRINDFKANKGWLDRFRKRHSILFKTNQGEAAGIDKSALNLLGHYSEYKLHYRKILREHVNKLDVGHEFSPNLRSISNRFTFYSFYYVILCSYSRNGKRRTRTVSSRSGKRRTQIISINRTNSMWLYGLWIAYRRRKLARKNNLTRSQ